MEHPICRYCPHFDNRTFTTVHRIGYYKEDKIRPIIAIFHHPKDKYLLQSKSQQIYLDHKISIRDDFPAEIDSARRKFLPIFKAARYIHDPNSGAQKPKLIGDKLILDKQVYSTKNINSLPNHLKPARVYTPSRNGITAFYTHNSPLSNHFQHIAKQGKTQFKVDGEGYNCMEQYFMISKALEFNDTDAVHNLNKLSDPVKMKEVGKQIKGFEQEKWLEVCDDKLMIGLRAKFTQNQDLQQFLLSTGDDDIAEASKNKVWGVGKTLNDPDLWKKETWGKSLNKMGNLLYKLREELKLESE